ncbi:MAG: Crp/Fnr family transcriptional regulator [Saprospiraceae bacterium]|nr:Crp/Fnr family transcriptional regulator [Saprospiraceae bacterium]
MISPSHNIDINSAFSIEMNTSFEALLPLGKVKKFTKGDFIVLEGDQCDGLYFIQSGIFRTFREDLENEYTTGFSFTGDFETSPFSLFYNTPCQECIQAITDAVALYISKKDALECAEKNPIVQRGYLLLMAAYIEILETRLHQHRSLTAEERYVLLREQQPVEINKIPLNYIASFLGISKERLSRIRKKHPN